MRRISKELIVVTLLAATGNIAHGSSHREALAECQTSLARALTAPEIALAAEDVRLAMRALGRITGTVRIDELLDIIFRDFCIGK